MKLLLVSVHKSGTNMITQAIGGNHAQIDGKVDPGENHPHPVTVQGIREFERFGRSHLPFHPGYESILRSENCKVLFLLRDPRDCIVSWAHFVDDMEGYEGFINFEVEAGIRLDALSVEERIDEILKVSTWEYERYAGWLDMLKDLVYPMWYEDVIKERLKVFSEFIDWLPIELRYKLDCNNPHRMINRIDPENCHTFRKGIIGDHKNYFDEERHELFWMGMSGVMERMGYS